MPTTSVRLLIVCVISVLLGSCSRGDRFTIKCDIRCLPTNHALLTYVHPNSGRIDTLDKTEISSGLFEFHGHVDRPQMCQIVCGLTRINLMVENSEISVRGSAMIPDEIEVDGSQSNDDWMYLLKKETTLLSEKKALWIDIVKLKKEDEKYNVDSLMLKYDSYCDSLMNHVRSRCKENPESFGNVYYLYYAYSNQIFSIGELEGIINQMDTEQLQHSEYYQYLLDELKLTDELAENMAAPDFAMPTPDDEMLTLETFSNRYLYVLFTATWCEKCEVQKQKLESLYAQYHRYGFDVMAVYLDHDAAAWSQYASKADDLWYITSDLCYWESPITKRYGVNEIPYGVLIDDRGIVIAVNPTEGELSYKLHFNLVSGHN